jgi:hypothetical protein
MKIEVTCSVGHFLHKLKRELETDRYDEEAGAPVKVLTAKQVHYAVDQALESDSDSPSASDSEEEAPSESESEEAEVKGLQVRKNKRRK